jgi:glycosyltransferase involved in cell wall biosynthesis
MAERSHQVWCAAPKESPLFDRLASEGHVHTLGIDIGPKLGRRSAVDLALRWRRYRNAVHEALAAWRGELRMELVHVQFKKEQLLATPIAARLGMAVVWTEHGPLPPALVRTRPAMWLYRRAARRTRAIICVARYVADNLAANGIAERQTRVCHNGIDLESTRTEQDEAGKRASVRSTLRLGRDDVVIAAVGRLTAIKGLEDLLRAASQLAATRLLIVGEGPQRGELESLAAGLRIADRVHFLGHRHDVNDLLAAVDIVAVPSLVEGLPFAAIEAMAARVPVVATAVGGLPELLDQGRAGVLIRPGVTSDLVKALGGLVADPTARARLAHAGRERVETHFTQARMMARTERMLCDAAGFQDSHMSVVRQPEVVRR